MSLLTEIGEIDKRYYCKQSVFQPQIQLRLFSFK